MIYLYSLKKQQAFMDYKYYGILKPRDYYRYGFDTMADSISRSYGIVTSAKLVPKST